MRSKCGIAVTLIAALAVAVTARAEVAGDRLQRGVYQEKMVGDLEAAMKIYQQIVADEKANRPHVAQAKYRLGMCFLKKGQNAAAVETFEKLIEEFPSQANLLQQARGQLTTLGHAPESDTATQAQTRLICAYPGQSKDAPVMAISPDGHYFVFADAHTANLVVRDLRTGEDRQLTHDKAPADRTTFGARRFFSSWLGQSATISADGKWVAYNWYNEDDERAELRIIGIDGSRERVVYDAEWNVRWISPKSWSPDGKQIVGRLEQMDGTGRIVMVSVAEGSLKGLKSVGKWDAENLSLSPDGRYVAYDFYVGDSNEGDIALLPVDGGPEIPVIEHPADDDLLDWAPDGRSLLFHSDRRGEGADAWVIQIIDGKPQGLPQRVKKGLHMGATAENGRFARDGSFYFAVARPREFSADVWIATLDAKTGRLVGDPKKVSQRFDGQTAGAGWSPDGKYVAYAAQFSSTNWQNPRLIVICDMETGQEREIPLKPEFRFAAWNNKFWSPDGRSVFFQGGDRRVNTGVCRLDVKTGEITLVVPPSDETVTWPTGLVPGGKSLFFVRSRWDSRLRRYTAQCLVKNLETGQEKELDSPLPGALSPDGQRLAGMSPGWPQMQSLLVTSTSGGNPSEVLRVQKTGLLGRSVCWTPDGRHLLFGKRDRKGGKLELLRIPAQGGEPEKVGLASDGAPMSMQLHPTGHQITYTGWTKRKERELWVLENFLPDLTTPQDILTGANRVLARIDYLFRVNDSNRDGAVTKEEAQPTFLANFQMYDANGDGRVELNEFTKGFDQTKMPGRDSGAIEEEDLQRRFAENVPFDFDLALPDLDGKNVSLEDLGGKLVIVNFWGTWCPPCRAETPHFVELYKKYRERGLEIVGVACEQQKGPAAIDNVRAYLKKNDVTYRCVMGNKAIRQQGPDANIFPRTIFFDRSGEARLVMTGYQSLATLEAIVSRMFEGLLSLELTGPDRDAFDSGESVLLSAKTVATGRSTVARVEFLVDGSLLATDKQSPFEATWQATTGHHVLTARAFDGGGRQYDSGLVSAFVGIHGLERSVVRSADDAEELGQGKMDDLASADLDFGQDEEAGVAPTYFVGVRFVDIRIPKGAQINRAYLQFTGQEAGDDSAGTAKLTMHGELSANSATFTQAEHNISSRQKTTASVQWSPGPWNVKGERSQKQRSPDLSSLIQEVVAQDDWHEGNALTLIVTGSGERDAVSFDAGGSRDAPMLHLEFD